MCSKVCVRQILSETIWIKIGKWFIGKCLQNITKTWSKRKKNEKPNKQTHWADACTLVKIYDVFSFSFENNEVHSLAHRVQCKSDSESFLD